ncbi:hypothetical protein OROMI_034509 [Orobanche minor]
MAQSSYILHSVCVFAGFYPGKNVRFAEVADKLGMLLATKTINVVHGGGTSGLMGRVAASAFLGKVKVLGIIPKPLADMPLVGSTIGDELKISNIQDRIVSMLHNADASIALPGGFGTMEELFHVITWAQLNIHHKPVGLLNIDGFFNGLIAFVDSMVETGFISSISRKILLYATTAEELLSKFAPYELHPDPFLSHINWTGESDRRKRKFVLESICPRHTLN